VIATYRESSLPIRGKPKCGSLVWTFVSFRDLGKELSRLSLVRALSNNIRVSPMLE